MRIVEIFRKRNPVKIRLKFRKKQPNQVHSNETGTCKTVIGGKTTCGKINTTYFTADVAPIEEPT